jgi:hypothetical protein
VGALLGTALLFLSGCGRDQPHELNAQTADTAQAFQAGGRSRATQPPAIAPLDTATRRVGDALSAKPDSARADSIAMADSLKAHYRSGEDPRFARQMGWPVNYPTPLPGALLPEHRIVAYYGNSHSKGMGVLGEYPTEEMLRRLKGEVARWNEADPSHPVVPALQLIVSVANDVPGSTGKYRTIMWDTTVENVHRWAKSVDGVFFIDIQTGQSTIQAMLPKFEHFLKQPDVHLAVDPEFMMVYNHAVPGTKVGNMRVSDINWITDQVARIVRENHLPPKVVVIHRFRRDMVLGDTRDILLRPEVQLVMDMDGWGAAWLKRDSYRDYIVRHPVEFTGFKLFYHNDTRGGSTLMTPGDVLRLRPQPLYIQYQ